MEISRELSRLQTSEYGYKAEWVFRLSAISCGAFVLYLYTGWHFAWLWLLIFFGLHLINYRFLKSRSRPATGLDLVIAVGLSLALVAHFLWLNTFLIANGDLAIQMCALTALACLMLWLVQRADTQIHLVLGQIALFAASGIYTLATFLPQISFVPAQLTTALCGTALVFYFSIALLFGRARALRLIESEQQIAEAQKLKALGQLAGGVAHDFNNILTATIGNLELSKEVPTEEERAQCLHEALLAARNGEVLARKILTFARPEPMASRSMNLAEMIDNVRLLGRRLMPADVQIFVSDAPPDMQLPVSEADATTALLNLMANARDAMPQGGKINVWSQPVRFDHARMMMDGKPIDPGCYLCLSVEDTGPGIPHNVLQRALEPFFTTKPEGKGSGLGLPLVANFARSNGGGLGVVTSSDGTCVSLYLPCEKPKCCTQQASNDNAADAA